MSQVYMHTVRDCLKSLSDRAFQERVWLASDGPELSSFVEEICGLFDDSGLGDAMQREELDTLVGPDAASAIRELRRAISRVEQTLSPHDLIAHPAMETVRTCASVALELLPSAHPTA